MNVTGNRYTYHQDMKRKLKALHIPFLVMTMAFTSVIAQTREQLTKDAESGQVAAQVSLAQMYLEGVDGEKNREEAFRWFLKAARTGDREAQGKVSNMYSLGEGVEKDPKKSFFWTKKSADLGVASAQYNLAVMYDNATGTEKSGNSLPDQPRGMYVCLICQTEARVAWFCEQIARIIFVVSNQPYRNGWVFNPEYLSSKG